MRIKSVQLAWFRGAADPVSLECNGRSMVVYGENGAGKSSFVDAIEYVIHDGKLVHLTHEYSGRNQERAIPNTHTPEDRSSALLITFQDNTVLGVKIARNGTHAANGAEAVKMDTWDYRRTVLRQDEVAEFISSRKGEKYSALLPLFGLHELEVAAENLRQLAKSVEQRSKLEQKRGALAQATLKRKQVFNEATDATIEAQITALHAKYLPNSAGADVAVCCLEVAAAITARMTALSQDQVRHLILRTIAGSDVRAAVTGVRDANAELAVAVEPLIEEKIGVLETAHRFALKLDDGDKVTCPACGQSVAADQFKAHVVAEQERLKAILAVFDERRAAIAVLIDILKTVRQNVRNDGVASWREILAIGPLKGRLTRAESFDPESIRNTLDEKDLTGIEQLYLPIIEAADQASRDAPADVKELSADKTTIDAANTAIDARALAGEITDIQALIGFVERLEAGIRAEIRARSQAVINDISDDIGTMWEALHPGEPIEKIRLYIPEDDKAIDVALKFHGKEQDSPRLTLSEGYRNSLGLCIFLAMAKREAGTDRPLFLDDVVISLDRNHRGMIVQLLESEFARRQVILFTHDRNWYAELRQQLDDKKWTFRMLLPYEHPTVGIRWSHKTTTFDDARAHLKDRPDSAGNDARKIMDVELALIAEKLQMRLPYLRGDKNDKRIWSDFLDKLIADGQKCLQKRNGKDYWNCVEAIAALDTARSLLRTWANHASHSFDVVRPEATKLIDACEKALESFKCSSCGKNVWYADSAAAESVQCQCGELRWRYGKG